MTSYNRALAVLVGLASVAVAVSVVAQTAPPPKATNLEPADLAKRLEGARAATRTYADYLKTELQTALKNGGPKAAMDACTTIGPDLNNKVSEETGFEIGRTSLRIRNPENVPDAWELNNLEQFAKQIAGGADYKNMEAYDVTVTSEGQKLFRYMKPIMTGDNCLVCHGPNISQELKAAIAKTYPDDKAVGFNLGELRGAFTLVQEVD